MADNHIVRYTVTHQQRMTEPNQHGQYVDKMRVHFTTPSGTASHVDMPMDYYTAHNVHSAIQPEVDRLEAVNSLQPGAPAPQPEQTP